MVIVQCSNCGAQGAEGNWIDAIISWNKKKRINRGALQYFNDESL